MDDVFDELGDVFVGFGGDGGDAAGTGGDLLDVGEEFFVFEGGAGVGGVLGGDGDDGEDLVDEGVGAVLPLAVNGRRVRRMGCRRGWRRRNCMGRAYSPWTGVVTQPRAAPWAVMGRAFGPEDKCKRRFPSGMTKKLGSAGCGGAGLSGLQPLYRCGDPTQGCALGCYRSGLRP